MIRRLWPWSRPAPRGAGLTLYPDPDRGDAGAGYRELLDRCHRALDQVGAPTALEGMHFPSPSMSVEYRIKRLGQMHQAQRTLAEDHEIDLGAILVGYRVEDAGPKPSILYRVGEAIDLARQAAGNAEFRERQALARVEELVAALEALGGRWRATAERGEGDSYIGQTLEDCADELDKVLHAAPAPTAEPTASAPSPMDPVEGPALPPKDGAGDAPAAREPFRWPSRPPESS